MSSSNLMVKSVGVMAIVLLAASNHRALGQGEWAKLASSDTALDNGTGRIVRSDGDVAVISAPADDENGYGSGAAYVLRFNGTTWVEEAKLVPGDGAAHDRFGDLAAISGDVIAVTAHADDCPVGADCGAVHVFRHNGDSWIEEAVLTAGDATHAGEFGTSLAIHDGAVVVGATMDDGWSAPSEYTYTFRFDGTGWSQEAEPALSDSDADFCDSLGGRSEDTNPVVGLDIQPGLCPNPLHPQSREVLLVAVVGTRLTGVADVDLGSLKLARGDGVGEAVRPLGRAPLTGSLQPDVTVEDVATPFYGRLCECHDATGDGTKDVVLRFSTSELITRLELDALRRNTEVTLTITGSLLDGTEFEASDCIIIEGQDAPPMMKRRKRDR
jgi:hypothetical protein